MKSKHIIWAIVSVLLTLLVSYGIYRIYYDNIEGKYEIVGLGDYKYIEFGEEQALITNSRSNMTYYLHYALFGDNLYFTPIFNSELEGSLTIDGFIILPDGVEHMRTSPSYTIRVPPSQFGQEERTIVLQRIENYQRGVVDGFDNVDEDIARMDSSIILLKGIADSLERLN